MYIYKYYLLHRLRGQTKTYGCYVNFFMSCLNRKRVCSHVLIPFTKHSITELILTSFSVGRFNLVLGGGGGGGVGAGEAPDWEAYVLPTEPLAKGGEGNPNN